jgi:hypothetical protein
MEKLKDSKKASGASEPSKTPFQSQFGSILEPILDNFSKNFGSFFECFLDPFLDHFWTTLGSIFGVICRFERGLQIVFFLGAVSGGSPEQSCEVSRTSWGSLVSPNVQNAGKKHIETHVCKNAPIRHPISLGTFLEAILAQFGLVWDPKMNAKNQ